MGTLVALVGLRLWLGPRTLGGKLDAGLLAILGLAGLIGVDRYGLSESRSSALRFVGWLIVLAYSAAMFFAAYEVFIGN